METTGIFRAGTSGLVLAEPNKKSFPAEYRDSSRLNYYASLNNSIEINSSFYKIPMSKTFANWYDMVPDDFQFTVKLWRGISHEKSFLNEDLYRFMMAADCLGKKKGCLLIQFSAKTKLNTNDLDNILKCIQELDRENSWRLAVEFRHSKWYQPEIIEILNSYQAGLVLHDMPGSAPETPNVRSPFIYYRFHGELGDYRGSYGNDYLKKMAEQMNTWLKKGKDVYAYFNNTIGDAVSNLNSLKKMVGDFRQK